MGYSNEGKFYSNWLDPPPDVILHALCTSIQLSEVYTVQSKCTILFGCTDIYYFTATDPLVQSPHKVISIIDTDVPILSLCQPFYVSFQQIVKHIIICHLFFTAASLKEPKELTGFAA